MALLLSNFEIMISELHRKSLKVGVKMNVEKPKIMYNNSFLNDK